MLPVARAVAVIVSVPLYARAETYFEVVVATVTSLAVGIEPFRAAASDIVVRAEEAAKITSVTLARVV